MTRQKKDIGLAGYYFDKETGEVVGEIGCKAPRQIKLKDFTMLFHEASEKLAKNEKLGLVALRVFLFAISRIDYEHRLKLTQADIARELGLKQQNINRAFKLLVSERILEEVDKFGTAKIYRLSPEYGNKGRARNYQDKLNKSPKSKNEQSSQKKVKTSPSSNLEEVA